MTEPVPAYAQYVYAILHARFASDSFGSDYLQWFVSSTMAKKTLHVLEKAGWIKSAGRGRYVCIASAEIFRGMIEFRVQGLLQDAKMDYSYADASAAEIWTDYTYIQRSWEHSPYYVRVLRSETKRWISYLRGHRIKVFMNRAKPSFGEFVILEPRAELRSDTHNGLPVEPLEEIVRYCEEHLDSFEYHLAYLRQKMGVKTNAKMDERVLAQVREAIA